MPALLKSFFGSLWQPLYGPPEAPSAVPNRRREYGELLSLAFTVCLAVFLVKTFIAYRDLDREDLPPVVCTGGFVVTIAQVWACSAQDFAVGLGCVLVGGMGLRLLRPTNARRGLRLVAHILAALALVYMIVNAQIYHVLRCFLSLSLFERGGGFKPERSIYAYATPTVKAALALGPVLTLALHLLLFHKLRQIWCHVAGILVRPVLLLGGIGVMCYVTLETQHTLFMGQRPDFTENPHLLLARSLFKDEIEFGDVGSEPPERADFLPGQPRLVGAVKEHRPTNVIVIVLECAGAHYLDIYGSPFPTTPCLRALGPLSLKFDNFYATSNHTIASALPICGSLWNDPRTNATLMEYPRFPVPAASSWLQQLGYKTAFIGSGGYEAWEGFRNLSKAFATTGWDISRDSSHPFWAEGGDRDRFQSPEYLDKAVFADARRFLRSAGKDKFFLMLWNYDTHSPFFGGNGGPKWDEGKFPPAVRGRPQEAELLRFLNALRSTDALIGELYKELETLGLADDTLVVVTADHGEAFGQHGTFMHGTTLFDEEVRVPLVLINRHVAATVGSRSTVVGSHIDLWPTITDICGLPFNPAWQGRSLLGDDDGDRRAFFSRREQVGVREGRFKYIWDHRERREWLFDLEADPKELTNLAPQNREYCLRQRRRLRDWTVLQTDLTKQRLMEGTSQ